MFQTENYKIHAENNFPDRIPVFLNGYIALNFAKKPCYHRISVYDILLVYNLPAFEYKSIDPVCIAAVVLEILR